MRGSRVPFLLFALLVLRRYGLRGPYYLGTYLTLVGTQQPMNQITGTYHDLH